MTRRGLRRRLFGLVALGFGAAVVVAVVGAHQPRPPTVDVVRAGHVYGLVQAPHRPLKWPDCGPVDHPCEAMGGVGSRGELTLLNGRCLGVGTSVAVWEHGTAIRGAGRFVTVRFAGRTYRLGDRLTAATDTLTAVTVGDVSGTIRGGAPPACAGLHVESVMSD
ncbi:MAG: hypothetical protein QOH37_1193 [Nocardioidaceae bacterium]|nr:hypothetical protein [Nocardioidaceae bacterium]